MITFLRGTLAEALPTHVVVDVGGVGYMALIPLSSYDRLPPQGTAVTLLTHLHVREDAHTLFGFATAAERDLFQLLLNHVSGVGPRIALAILSGMPVAAFKTAVVNGDVASLAKIKGVGRKTADRIVLELKDKVGVAAAWEAASAAHAPTEAERHLNDALLALISLGYKQVDAHRALRQAAASSGAVSAEDLVREALKLLA